jgi:hypothetical protein
MAPLAIHRRTRQPRPRQPRQTVTAQALKVPSAPPQTTAPVISSLPLPHAPLQTALILYAPPLNVSGPSPRITLPSLAPEDDGFGDDGDGGFGDDGDGGFGDDGDGGFGDDGDVAFGGNDFDAQKLRTPYSLAIANLTSRSPPPKTTQQPTTPRLLSSTGLATPPVTPRNASNTAGTSVGAPLQPSLPAPVHAPYGRASLQGTPSKHGAVLRALADAVGPPPPTVMKSTLREWELAVEHHFLAQEPPVVGLKKGQHVAINRTYGATQHMLSFFPKPSSEQASALAETLYHRRIGLMFSQDDKYAHQI